MRICIYGASSCVIDPSYIDEAEKLSKILAKNGYSLVFGCGANGLMGAAARGFYSENAEIIGVVPSFFNVDGILFEHCTNTIRTDTMRERKQIMEDLSDAFITTPGGIGTFEEFFEMLTLKQLGRHTKPMILYNINGYYDKMLDMLNTSVDEKFMNKETLDLFAVLNTPDEVINYLNTYVPQGCTPEQMKHIYTKK